METPVFLIQVRRRGEEKEPGVKCSTQSHLNWVRENTINFSHRETMFGNLSRKKKVFILRLSATWQDMISRSFCFLMFGMFFFLLSTYVSRWCGRKDPAALTETSRQFDLVDLLRPIIHTLLTLENTHTHTHYVTITAVSCHKAVCTQGMSHFPCECTYIPQTPGSN